MNGLIQKMKNDPEIQKLKDRCYELTGEWIPFHWDCFKDLNAYKEYMKNVIAEYE